MPGWADLERRQSELETARAAEESVWRDLARMLEEDGGDLNNSQGSSRGRPETFDSTPLYAKDDFVEGLFTEAINPADPWFELTIDDDDLKKFSPVAQFLSDMRKLVVSTLDPSVSGFYVEALPWFDSLAKYGNGFLSQEEITGRGAIAERALPVMDGDGGIYIDVDAEGNLDTLHRKFKLTGLQAKKKWGEKAPNVRDDERATFLHALYPNPDYQPGALGPRGKPILSCYCSPDRRDWSLESGFYEMPIHSLQWSKRAGRVWAMGPGHKALADMGMLDEEQRSILTALQFEAEPMLLTHDDAILSAADIQPSAVISAAMSSQGKPLVQKLDRGDQLQLPLAHVQGVQKAVREAFKFSLMQVLNRPQMTGQEFLGWKEESLRKLAPYLVSVHRGLATFIVRRVQIIMRLMPQRIPPAPPELQGQPIKIGFKSPFVQAQKSSMARAKMQLGQAAIGLQPLNPEIGDNLDTDNMLRTIAEGLTGDPADVRDPREVQQRRQARQQAQQDQAGMEQAAQASDIYANVAHAQQAQTLAKARTQPR